MTNTGLKNLEQELKLIAQKLQPVKQAGYGSVLIRVERHMVEEVSYSIREKVKGKGEKIE